ncbi:protein of unknown function DUF4149 [Dillenia turbinata]|uniref:TMEM205-like domain-containing protein n=1 Tax=Dillenia turbinata TaxID=194707 RepID=A0AAN8ZL06_9MAGN
MMNFLTICLVLTSLASAGKWSPSPERNHHQDQKEVIVKEGHRVIVVEYEKGAHRNTKVSISPQDHTGKSPLEEVEDKAKSVHETAKEKLSSVASSVRGEMEDAKDKFKETSSVLPDVGQGVSESPPTIAQNGPKELICDAFGKCKHKIASAIDKAKEMASGKAHEAYEKAGEVKDEAKEAVDQAVAKAKEKAYRQLEAVKEAAEEAVDKAKKTAKTGKDMVETLGEHVFANVTAEIGIVRQWVGDKAKEAQEKAKELKEETKKDVNAIIQSGREFSHRVMVYGSEMLGWSMEIIQLLGFATAYGMCVWITFVSSHVLEEALPRQQFGMVQSKVYPVYFRAMACSIGMALIGHLLGQRKMLFTGKAEMFQGYNLVSSLVLVFANMTCLEPRATKVMFERIKVEKEEGRGRGSVEIADFEPITETSAPPRLSAQPVMPERLEHQRIGQRVANLNQRLKKLNACSSLLNALTLMSLTWHLVYIGQRLQA